MRVKRGLLFLLSAFVARVTESAESAGLKDTERRDAAVKLIQAALCSPELFSLEDAKVLLENHWTPEQTQELIDQTMSLEEENVCRPARPVNLSKYYVDRHAQAVNAIVNDKDCMEREFDVKNPDYYDPDYAAHVLAKCRIVVLRNVLPRNLIAHFKPQFASYIRALNAGKISHQTRVIYDSDSPSKRYEIFLPITLARKTLFADEDVMHVLEHPDVLGYYPFMHSYGSVITEPGAAHQGWHEEDEYLFGANSMKEHGVAGHDLPPYSVNFFTPLLDLTYDHGPTEFCVGSSILSGMQDEKDNFQAFDSALIKEGTPFARMMRFAQRTHLGEEEPCPAEFWRSVLLNIGDVVLFDYQILHRAGQNLSNETRAQIYINYARTWFRDFNYMQNEDIGPRPPINDLVHQEGRIITRFAELPANRDDLRHCISRDCKNESPLESLREILLQKPYTEHFLKGLKVEFYVTNIDIENALVTLTHTKKGTEVTAELPLGKQIALEASVEDVIKVTNKEGAVLKAWEVGPDLRQLVVSKAVVGV